MKLIGLLGSTGWKPTATCYRLINDIVRRELGSRFRLTVTRCQPRMPHGCGEAVDRGELHV